MKKNINTILIFSLFILAGITVCAQDAGKSHITISGEVASPFTLSTVDFKKFSRNVVVRKDRDGKDHSYSGVSLSILLIRAGATMGKDLRGENLIKYVSVEAKDGYQVIFSLAELDKDFVDKDIILSDEMDGKPLPLSDGPFRIIIQDEKKPARCIKQVASIRVAFAK